jgi:ElaB/YqjD/DUF883 family membrane-anchored ribosome-binding protein
VLTSPMDASLKWCSSTPPLWHTKAVGGRPPHQNPKIGQRVSANLAECEPEMLNEVPVPLGQGLEEGNESTRQQAGQASGLARDIYWRGQTYMEHGRRSLPETQRHSRESTQAISRPVQEHPRTALVVMGAVGCALGWMLGHRVSTSTTKRQWHPGSNRRPSEPHHWHPSPCAARHARHLPADNEAASHTTTAIDYFTVAEVGPKPL